MATGRARLKVGTYGDISTTRTIGGHCRAWARFRDWDGEVRKVTAVGSTAKSAKTALRTKLARRSAAHRIDKGTDRPLPRRQGCPQGHD